MSFDIRTANARLAGAPAEEIIEWAVEEFSPDLALSSSFQTQSLPLLHIVSRVAPRLPILFLDTGFHFPETLAFRDRLIDEWGLNVKVLRRDPASGPVFSREPDLYRRNPDLCCRLNKVEPMRRATRDLRAWVSGIRRDQTPERSGIEVVEQQEGGFVRVHPMAAWTSRDVFTYIAEHELPEHPLLVQGYMSVGCAPCTRPVLAGTDERAGRWTEQDRTECGLHTELRTAGGRALPVLPNVQH